LLIICLKCMFNNRKWTPCDHMDNNSYNCCINIYLFIWHNTSSST
jgi:hypothetical protein